MPVGPNSRWACKPDCTCSVSKERKRCRLKVGFIADGEILIHKIAYTMWKLDLDEDESDSSRYYDGPYRSMSYNRKIVHKYIDEHKVF